jgi:hypothetical protein
MSTALLTANFGETLKCYASGDGALHFTWLAGDKATGRTVTLAEAQAFLDSPDGEHLKEKGWRVVVLNRVHPVLVADVRRLNDDTLIFEGREYVYSHDTTNVFWTRDRYVQDHCLSLMSEKVIEVRNCNTRAAIRHFLNNEKWLAPVVPDFQI